MDIDERSTAFSILKCEYGWGGCTDTVDQQKELDSICKASECPNCAAAAMAAYLNDNVGPKTFRKRLDGKPNTRTVERDRAGQKGGRLQ